MISNINLVTTFVTIFTIIDPFGLIPIFLGATGSLPKKERRKTVFISSAIALILSTLFLFFGGPLIEALGLSFESFYIAGGILLFLVALDMLFARPRRTKSSPDDEESSSKSGNSENYLDISVFPLAIPMLAGPGTIASIIMFSSQAKNTLDYLMIFACIFVSLLIAMVAMFFSEYILKVLKNTGLNVIDRLMGMILAAMAVQFVINAINSLWNS